MVDDMGPGDSEREEIEGAPPLASRTELRTRRMAEMVTVNRYLYQQVQQLEHMLLRAPDLDALLEILLVSMPRHFSFRVSELWLYDPEEILAKLLVGAQRYGPSLRLLEDVFPMQDLYELEPDVVCIDATDSRMFEVLTSERGIDAALLMPLTDGGRMLGSLHMGLQEDFINLDGEEQALLAHLAAIISACFKAGVSRQQISRITLLDPLTEISNLRGFEKDIAREIARARRANEALSVLMLEVDEFEELYRHYGEITGRFVLKKVTERVSSGLRATDYLARLSDSRLAVLLSGTSESPAIDVAERIRRDIENFLIDDGRGAVLQVTLSLGLVTWEPEQYPAVDMAQLARQMQSAGSKAVQSRPPLYPDDLIPETVCP